MANSTKKILQQEYNRLKKIFEKITSPEKKQSSPQLVLQPVRNQPDGGHGKKYLRGTSLS